MTAFDYRAIIFEYNAKAFKDCVNQLYPLFGYLVTPKSAIRRIDLEEQLLQLENSYLMKKNNKNPVETYAEAMSFFVENEFNPSKSIEAYQIKARKIVNLFKNGNYSTDLLEDLVKIFISFTRCDLDKWKNPEAKYRPFSFEILSEDTQLLMEFKSHKFIQERWTDGVIKKKLNVVYYDQATIDYIYVITVLVYCRLMQFEGRYLERT